MLEWPGENKLKTWRIDTDPQDWNLGPMTAEQIFAHDKKYLTYQGQLSNNKGRVEIADTGELKIISEQDEQIKFTLLGKIANGNFILAKNQDNYWQLIFKLDTD